MNSFFRFFIFLVILFSKGNLSIDNFMAKIKLSDFSFFQEFVDKIEESDVVGRIVIDSLEIDSVLVQGQDNDFYLNHDIYGNSNNFGSVFLDYRNSIDLDRKLLVYGHNSKDGNVLFNRLEEYLSVDFFNNKNNNNIKIITGNKEILYEVSNVLIIDNDSFGHMKLTFNEDSWINYIDWINSNSLYGDSLNYLDDILILQTCNYNPDNSFLLIVAREVEEFYF